MISFGNGIVCNNCYSYVGADLETVLSCTYDTTITPMTLNCIFQFAAGGETDFKGELTMTDPEFELSTGTYPIVAAPAGAPSSIADSDYQMLFNFDGVMLYAAVGLDFQLDGYGSATGSATAAAGFSTDANYFLKMV